MRIILLQDIENLGKKYEVKDVKDGYARNFLIPKGLAKLATEKAIKWAEEQKEAEEKKVEEELRKIQELASSIEGQEVVISAKVGEEGQLFKKINSQDISEKLAELGFNVKKEQIMLEKPISELGEFAVKIRFAHNLEAEIRVVVTEEKS